MCLQPFATASAPSAAQSSGGASMDHHEIGTQSRTLFPSSEETGTPKALPTASKSAIWSPPWPSTHMCSAALWPIARSTASSLTVPSEA